MSGAGHIPVFLANGAPQLTRKVQALNNPYGSRSLAFFITLNSHPVNVRFFSLSLTSSPSSGLFLAPVRFDIQKDIKITNLTTVFRGRISLVDVCGPLVFPPV